MVGERKYHPYQSEADRWGIEQMQRYQGIQLHLSDYPTDDSKPWSDSADLPILAPGRYGGEKAFQLPIPTRSQ